MGASKSKMAQAGGSQVTRAFPSRPSPTIQTRIEQQNQQPQQQQQQSHPPRHLTENKPNIQSDSQDPIFAQRLHDLGVVPPNPFIPLSQQGANTIPKIPLQKHSTVLIYEARTQSEKQYDLEQEQVGRSGFQGRHFLEAARLGDALRLRATGLSDDEVERKFDIAKGTLSKINAKDIGIAS